MVLEQALVDRTELLDVEAGVVDPATDTAPACPAAALGRVLEGREVEQRPQQVLVAAGGGLEVAAGMAAEQLAIERGEPEHRGVAVVAEQQEGLCFRPSNRSPCRSPVKRRSASWRRRPMLYQSV
jgi:hypothetical protein